MQEIGRVGFDNATFWDERSRTIIELESGAGPRGEFLLAKRRLGRDVVARLRPRSVLDVLIHQRELESSREFARALFDGSRVAAIMNGFVTWRQGRKPSPNDAFHEPSAHTPRGLGSGKLGILTAYRRTALVLVQTG
jgi:hypothetical protein